VTAQTEFFLRVGDRVEIAKTVGESDVYLFAGITGDLSSNHVNEAVMRRSKFGRRLAHGALLVGYMSAASTKMIETHGASAAGISTAVALGYDRIRFVAPVFFGDTITVHYTIDRIEPERQRSYAEIKVLNEHGTTVAVAEHILKWVADVPPSSSGHEANESGGT
jgi:3-hydroxybutyryl-CoA dehydratase